VLPPKDYLLALPGATLLLDSRLNFISVIVLIIFICRLAVAVAVKVF